MLIKAVWYPPRDADKTRMGDAIPTVWCHCGTGKSRCVKLIWKMVTGEVVISNSGNCSTIPWLGIKNGNSHIPSIIDFNNFFLWYTFHDTVPATPWNINISWEVVHDLYISQWFHGQYRVVKDTWRHRQTDRNMVFSTIRFLTLTGPGYRCTVHQDLSLACR